MAASTSTSGNVVVFQPAKDATIRVDYSHAIANPGPLGLFAFGLTTAWLSSANAGYVEADFTNVVWCYALFWGGATQWAAGILEFFKKNIFGATAFCTYGAFWMGLGLFQLLVASKAITLEDSMKAGMTGYFACWGILTMVYTVGASRISVALLCVFIPLVAAFWTLLGAQYSTTSAHAAGWFGMIAAVAAFYAGAAAFLNEIFGSVILPTGSPELIWGRAVPPEGLIKGVEYDDDIGQSASKA